MIPGLLPTGAYGFWRSALVASLVVCEAGWRVGVETAMLGAVGCGMRGSMATINMFSRVFLRALVVGPC